ncbi:MAG: response regulator [Myxococcales bacterium]|nr:response regulator [Myxococcales bacterium]
MLLLDDDQDLRALLRHALGPSSEVLEAGTIAAAEATLQTRSVDLVVVDGLLPDGSGVAFVEQLRARDRRIRIVFVSAYFRDLHTFRHLTTDLDVSLVLYKPFDPSSVAASLVRLLTSSQVAPIDTRRDAAFALEVAELSKAFGHRLPEKIAALEAAILAAKSLPTEFARAQMLAHRLRGSAGSYGFHGVGEAAGRVEELLSVVRDGAPRSFWWTEIENALRDAKLASEQASPAPSPTPSKALLVVDDDPEVIRLVVGLARSLVVPIVTAESSYEAVRLARGRALVGAILDVHLFGEESFGLAREIRETPENEHIPIAFASVDGRLETRVAAIEAGGTRFFDKPISVEGFSELVEQFLRLSETRQSRVLVVDDDQEVADQYATHLRNAGYFVDQLPSADGLVERLEDFRPDVLLLDVALPHVSGIDVCHALRISQRWEFLPILLVTGQLDPHTRLRAFRAGASDVIGKPVLMEELLARVGVQDERMRLLRDRADRDSLSQLMLRRAFVEAFQRALASAAREHGRLSLVLFDIDHFKRVNDEHGHLAGDQVIAKLGELLRRRFRAEDLRARWGGEEFMLVFPGQDLEFAARSAERLRADLSQLVFTADDGTSFQVSVTAGVSAYPDDGSSTSALIRRADQRLFSGKAAGRNQVVATDARASSEDREGRP